MNDSKMLNFTIPEFSVQWFFLPPFTAVGVFVVLSFFSGGTAVPVDAAIWGLTGLLFIILSVLYGIFIRRNFYKGLLPVQLVAQGLFLCPLSLQLGAQMFQWVGVTMAVCGTVVLVIFYYRSLMVFVSVLQSVETSPGFESLPIPFAITDEEGFVLSISDTLLQMTNQVRQTALGEQITHLLPINGESVNLDGKEWTIVQSHMPGDKCYFQLEEAQFLQPIAPPAKSDAPLEAVDAVTTLHNLAYAVHCTNEEIYRVRRYKRWLSVALLRMVFEGGYPFEKEQEIFNAYARFVGANIRETDTACLVALRDIYVIMPETPLEGARVALGKLTDYTPHLQEELRDFGGTIRVLDKPLFFGPSVGEISFDDIMNRLSSALGTP
ncbi:MAG: hypothetical protein LBO82_08440 [Synergistaceae bacterium]|jgi:hypothetical protein|nr:hypothetical protein [Synergistaceae bacterium]